MDTYVIYFLIITKFVVFVFVVYASRMHTAQQYNCISHRIAWELSRSCNICWQTTTLKFPFFYHFIQILDGRVKLRDIQNTSPRTVKCILNSHGCTYARVDRTSERGKERKTNSKRQLRVRE